MALSLGIVGLPNVGKSTLFNAITQSNVEASNYPFCTIDPNVGIVTVPDHRLKVLSGISKSQKIIPTAIEFWDIAGLVQGASKGEGLGNQFLANIREVQALLHVVRCFEDENILHVEGRIDPLSDIDIINLELILADLSTLEKRIQGNSKKMKSQDKTILEQMVVYEKLKNALDAGKPARIVELTDQEESHLKDLSLLSRKPVIYVANVSENDISFGLEQKYVKKIVPIAKEEKALIIVISSKIEQEISQLSPEEAAEYFSAIGITESGLDKLAKASYELLGLISYLTTGEKETRAWAIKKGTKGPQAAAVIHSDFEKGFIKAEVVSYEDLVRSGSFQKAREEGVLRLEGKEYVVRDGDCVDFKVNA